MTETSKVDPLVKREWNRTLRNGLTDLERMLGDRIEALTAERDRAIDDARDNAEYVDLVSQFRAERDAAKADNARLTAIVSAMKRYQAGEPSDPPVTGVPKVDIAAFTGKETK